MRIRIYSEKSLFPLLMYHHLLLCCSTPGKRLKVAVIACGLVIACALLYTDICKFSYYYLWIYEGPSQHKQVNVLRLASKAWLRPVTIFGELMW